MGRFGVMQTLPCTRTKLAQPIDLFYATKTGINADADDPSGLEQELLICLQDDKKEHQLFPYW